MSPFGCVLLFVLLSYLPTSNLSPVPPPPPPDSSSDHSRFSFVNRDFRRVTGWCMLLLFPSVHCAYSNPQTKFGADTFIYKKEQSHFQTCKLGAVYPQSQGNKIVLNCFFFVKSAQIFSKYYFEKVYMQISAHFIVYTSLCRPHIEYAASVWDTSLDYLTNDIGMVQHKDSYQPSKRRIVRQQLVRKQNWKPQHMYKQNRTMLFCFDFFPIRKNTLTAAYNKLRNYKPTSAVIVIAVSRVWGLAQLHNQYLGCLYNRDVQLKTVALCIKS